MSIDLILAALIAERARLTRAIEALEGPARHRGRPRKNPLTAAKHGGMSTANRKAQAARMKAYWAKRRTEAARES